MAKPYKEITKTDFSKNYNVVKILTTKTDIMDFVKTQYQETKDNTMAFAVRKTRRVTIDEKLDLIMNEIKGIKTRLENLENLVHNVIKLNNLKAE